MRITSPRAEEHKKTVVLAQVLANPALLPSETIMRIADDGGRTWVLKALCFGILCSCLLVLVLCVEMGAVAGLERRHGQCQSDAVE